MGNWQLDPYHTQVEFSAKHLGMMTVRGYFDEVSTTADIDPDHPETAKVEWSYEQTFDPYGSQRNSSKWAANTSLALSTPTIWVWFGDIPEETKKRTLGTA